MATLSRWPTLWQICRERVLAAAEQQSTEQPRAQSTAGFPLLCLFPLRKERQPRHVCTMHQGMAGSNTRALFLMPASSKPDTSSSGSTRVRVRDVSAPSAEDCQVANEVVDCILFAHTVVGPMAKCQEIFLVLDVLLAFWAKAIGVKALWLGESLEQEVQGVGTLCRQRECKVRCVGSGCRGDVDGANPRSPDMQ